MTTSNLTTIHIESGETVSAGDHVIDFRGNGGKFERATRAEGVGHEGKVIVDGLELYASVFGLQVRNQTEWERQDVAYASVVEDVEETLEDLVDECVYAVKAAFEAARTTMDRRAILADLTKFADKINDAIDVIADYEV